MKIKNTNFLWCVFQTKKTRQLSGGLDNCPSFRVGPNLLKMQGKKSACFINVFSNIAKKKKNLIMNSNFNAYI